MKFISLHILFSFAVVFFAYTSSYSYTYFRHLQFFISYFIVYVFYFFISTHIKNVSHHFYLVWYFSCIYLLCEFVFELKYRIEVWIESENIKFELKFVRFQIASQITQQMRIFFDHLLIEDFFITFCRAFDS